MNAEENLSLAESLGEMRGMQKGTLDAIGELRTVIREHAADDKSMFADLHLAIAASEKARATATEQTLSQARTVAIEVLEHARLVAAEQLEAERKATTKWRWDKVTAAMTAVLGSAIGVVAMLIKAAIDHPPG